MRRSVLASAAMVAAALDLASAPLGASEFGATHLVFEKATPMKKVAATLYMSVVDRSVKGDEPGNRRRLRCAVAARGKRGALPARGQVIVRLRGEAGSGTSWRSSALTEPLDGIGHAEFDVDAILGLVDEANADRAVPELFIIEFDGGKGKKVTQVTVDCVHEVSEG